jgi:Amt family ammonium transporter
MGIKKLKIDDPVDASSVHGTCGIWGCLAAAIFDFGSGTDKHHGWGGFSATSYEEDGEVKYMTTGDAIAANVAEIGFVIAWSGGLSLLIFGALKATKLLRIDEETVSSGMDSECASPKAYNIVPNNGQNWASERSSSPDTISTKASEVAAEPKVAPSNF